MKFYYKNPIADAYFSYLLAFGARGGTDVGEAFYSVARSDGLIMLEMIPSGGWFPNESKLSLRFLYRIEPMFTQWPTTYRWSAELEQDEDSRFRMASNWERINTD